MEVIMHYNPKDDAYYIYKDEKYYCYTKDENEAHRAFKHAIEEVKRGKDNIYMG
jgi:hypothetical protein